MIKGSIRLKLILSYAAIALLITVALSLFTRWNLTGDVRNLLREQAILNFEDTIIDYYEDNETLEGFGAEYQRKQDRKNKRDKDDDDGPPPPQNGEPPPNNAILGLADADGRVILPLKPKFEQGDRLNNPYPKEFQLIEFNGETIGYMLVSQDRFRRTPAESDYINRANIAFGAGSVIAVGLAVLLGFFMSRPIVNPLMSLTKASQAMAAGKLDQQVSIETDDEIGQLAQAFNQMSSDLDASNQQRKQMTADIAHDLRSPLAVIAGYIESMRDEVLAPTPARFDTIYSEIEHLQHLISDLRTLSRADAGELPLNLQHINPQELIDRTISTFQLQAEQKNIEIEAVTNLEVPPIKGDEERLAQVLGNLINNAIRHTPENGAIRLNGAKADNGVRLSIEDTGEGIPADALPHVFDRFYRVDEARQQNSGESGLGLAIAKSLIEAHGGTIEVFSRVGFGTRFDIFLPTLA